MGTTLFGVDTALTRSAFYCLGWSDAWEGRKALDTENVYYMAGYSSAMAALRK